MNYKPSLCPLLPTFSLTVHPPSFFFFSCFTGLFAVLWQAGQDLASGHLHAVFLLPGRSFPTISTSFSIQAFTKGHPLSLHPSPYFILFQSTYQGFTHYVSFLLIDWFCPLQWKVNPTEAGFRWIHSSPCPRDLEKCLVVGRNWITYAEYVII